MNFLIGWVVIGVISAILGPIFAIFAIDSILEYYGKDIIIKRNKK